MRPLLLALPVLLISLTPVKAQFMPASMPTTYPEAGTFCGTLKFCEAEKIASDSQ